MGGRMFVRPVFRYRNKQLRRYSSSSLSRNILIIILFCANGTGVIILFCANGTGVHRRNGTGVRHRRVWHRRVAPAIATLQAAPTLPHHTQAAGLG